MLKKLIAVLAVLMVIVGCSNGSKGGDDKEIVTEITEPVEVIFWHAMNGAQEAALTKLTDDFMAANKNIKIVLQNQSSYNDLQQKLTATMGSPSNLPVLTQAYPGWVYDASKDNMLQDLKPYIDHSKIGMTDFTDIVEAFRKGSQIDDVQYGMPFNKSSEVLFYNKDVFDKLGLEAPKTMEDFVAAAKKISAETDMVGGGFDSLNNYFVTFMNDKGVTLNADMDVTSQAAKDTVNFYLDGIKGDYLRIAGSDKYLSGPFGNQLIAMNIGSTAGESYIRKGAEGRFTPAAVPVPVKSTIQQGTDIYMFSSGTAEQKTAAFLYMKHLVSAESQLYWAKETGYIPVRTSVMNSEEYTSLDTLIAPIAKDITKDMYTIPTSAHSNAAFMEFTTTMEAILSSKDSNVDDQLKNLSNELKSIWAD